MRAGPSCTVQNFGSAERWPVAAFAHGLPRLKAVRAIGPGGCDDRAKDLLDLAVAVMFAERNLPGRQAVHRASEIELCLPVREPAAWSERAQETLRELLYFMGGAHWRFRFMRAGRPTALSQEGEQAGPTEAAVLFSGGMDSLCGAAVEGPDGGGGLVGFYTRQATLQRELSRDLGFPRVAQWGWAGREMTGRGKSFRYRGFFYLALAAVTARSCGCTQIRQYENGILASGIAPSQASMTTKHAHYRVHRLCEQLFGQILTGDWCITNPFQATTKKEACEAMVARLGESKAHRLACRAETCWNLYAGLKDGDRKKPNGLPCGFCVPCLVRGTAHRQRAWRDLRGDTARNHPRHGRFFREYYTMLSQVRAAAGGSLADFRASMGTYLQDAVAPRGGYSLGELRELFTRFAAEFMDAYHVR